MGKKKRYNGHYCKVCGEIKSNEKFTGKGHKNHICKKCSKKPVQQRAEESENVLYINDETFLDYLDGDEELYFESEFQEESFQCYEDSDDLPF